MRQVQSFAPIENANAHVLILGSMPGEASLRVGQYYAHPRNLFWHIMGELVGAGPGMPYEQRIRALRSANIALWDVLHSCSRKGSLDSNIDDGSLIANDFAAFFRRHPRITMCFSMAPRLKGASGNLCCLTSKPNPLNTCACRLPARRMLPFPMNESLKHGAP